MSTFVITTNARGEYHFNLKAGNGEIILTSENYGSKAACDNGISSVKANASKDENYDRKRTADGQYYFNLKADNGQVIGTSERYQSTQGRDNGIESVKKNAATAVTV
jgi:uncharacterized protein